MNDSTPPAVAPASKDANGFSFSLPLPDILIVYNGRCNVKSKVESEQVVSRLSGPVIVVQSPLLYSTLLTITILLHPSIHPLP
jgi:hypothetical protein